MTEYILSKTLLDETETFTNSKLNKKDDLVLLLEEYSKNKTGYDFEELAFTGKHLNGLFRVLASGQNNPEIENLDNIKKDISDNLEKVIFQLKKITSSMNDMNRDRLQKNYIELTNITLQNLRELAEDLDDIKKYLNYLKRKQLINY